MKINRKTEAIRLTLIDTHGKRYEVTGTRVWRQVVPLSEPASAWQEESISLMWGSTPVEVLEDGSFAPLRLA
jgi:hypothetical protein